MAGDEVGELDWRRTWIGDRPALYGVTGPSDGMPVLFLHGWALGHRAYRPAIGELVDLGCRVHSPALPGFGGTPELPGSRFSMAGYARWLDGFLEAIGVNEPVLAIGHSFGGGVAIKFAHAYGDRVRSLVLVNSIGGAAWRDGDGARAMAERPLWDWGLRFPGDVWPIPQAAKVVPMVLQDAVTNMVRNPVAVWRVSQLVRRADLTREMRQLGESEMPVLVLWGARDGLITRASFDALCLAVGSSGEVVEGSHSWLLADPAGFGRAMAAPVENAALVRQLERDDRAVDPPSAPVARPRHTR